MSKNLYFVCSDAKYHNYAVMCINSLIKNTNNPIMWLQVGYVDTPITSSKLFYKNVNVSDYDDIYNNHNYDMNRLSKSIRFIELDKIIQDGTYDNICLLDCDMVVLTNKMDLLFDLVDHKNCVLGVNENFKWIINDDFTVNGQRIFSDPTKLNNFTCSVPLFFNCSYMKHLVKTYLKCFLNGKMKYQEQIYDMGDMFAYNISMKWLDKDDNVIMFPAEMFTQTHMDGYLPWNRILKNENNQIVTKQGLVVYSLHGRMIDDGYKQMIIRETDKVLKSYGYTDDQVQKYIPNVKNVINLIEAEFKKYA